MILEKETQAVKLSTTNKDYYAIWQELLETAGKISERWIPESTNESDPGIVLLKVLTAIADKLNYNIDKNILEAFMPSATQEDSMRKLCEMMGYSMKYYQSATTKVSIVYNGLAEDFGPGELVLPKFTQFTDIDKEVNYVSLNQVSFSLQINSNIVECIEGVIGTCEEDNDGIVSINNLDDNYRYYLPIADIAENGIFISNYVEGASGDEWEAVDNLNAQALGKKCFKFGYDSKELLPYIQFPDDISSLIADGLIIQYVQTNGINGNISAKTISSFVAPSGWDSTETENNKTNRTGKAHTAEEFYTYNTTAAANGADKESLTDAYLNFKKTVGTFDTLVTCRDYMNKIHELTVSSTDTTNLVSNIIVSDIRDDINKAITICSFNEFGISYIDTPITYKNRRSVKPIGSNSLVEFEEIYNAIDNFELVLYPFKKIYGLNNEDEYVSSFKYDKTVYNTIVDELSTQKTISHQLILPKEGTSEYEEFMDIIAIKNYLKLNARITTTEKVNEIEYAYILDNIKRAIFKNFNARKLDFGEEIPFDSILKTIENADARIKNVSLDEPILYTKFLLSDNTEYDIASTTTNVANTAKQIYNKLALRNILAGRLSLFNYENEFIASVTETKYAISSEEPSENFEYNLIYPNAVQTDSIKYLVPKLTLNNVKSTKTGACDIKLKENQIVQFRAPNFKTKVTYPAYVNYFLHLTDTSGTKAAIPATFTTLRAFMNTKESNDKLRLTNFMNDKFSNVDLESFSATEAIRYQTSYGCVYTRTGSLGSGFVYSEVNTTINPVDMQTEYYLYLLNSPVSYAEYYRFITDQTYLVNSETKKLAGIYRSLGTDQSRVIGKMIDANKIKYQLTTTWTTEIPNPFTYFYVQQTHDATVEPTPTDPGHTADGFGRDAEYCGISANEEYKLKLGEYLCINYTNGASNVETTDAGNSVITTDTDIINNYYGTGVIIKPNMELISSEAKRASGPSYSKTTGFHFDINQPDGMFCLGANEQIEIREQASTLIYDNNDFGFINIYFKLNNEGVDGNTVTLVEAGASYILEEGEYFWYTNRDKTILNYFGSGNKIVNNTGRDIKKIADSSQISTEEILEKGVDVIPWKPMTGLTYDKTNPASSENHYIQVDEYQYITLVENDVLEYVKLDPETDNATLNDKWKDCSEAGYICDSVEDELPKIDVDTAVWQVKTKLAVNTGPNTKQTLHVESNQSLGTTPYCVETIIAYSDKPAVDKKIVEFDHNDVSIKTNYTVSSTNDIIQTYYKIASSEEIDDFMIKTFKNNTINISEIGSEHESEEIILNNMNNYYTSFTFQYGAENYKYTTLHCALNDPNKQFGIILLYYRSYSQDPSDSAFIKLANTIPSGKTPIIFNNYNDSTNLEEWWYEVDNTRTQFEYNQTDEVPGDWKLYYTCSGTSPNLIYTLVKEWPEYTENTYYVKNDDEYQLLANETAPSGWGSPWYTNYYTKSINAYNTYKALEQMEEWQENRFYSKSEVSGSPAAGAYALKPNALNVIKLTASCDIEIYCGQSEKFQDDAIIFSPLRIVNVNILDLQNNITDYGINNKLIDYQQIDNQQIDNLVTAEKQLLDDIRDKDPDFKFFYNTNLDNSLALDINEQAGEALRTERIWYDYNNINNKFVISEIDSKYLDIGIILAASSKKNY